MRENAKIKIVGKNVILIPYEKEHVEKYGINTPRTLIFLWIFSSFL